MKYFVWLISTFNFCFGIYHFLNVIHLLDSSKYSKTATFVFAVLFLGMGISSFYLSLIKHNQSFALWIAIGPWILSLLFMFIVMITSDYK